MKEKEYQKYAASGQKYRRRLIYRLRNGGIIGESCQQGANRSKGRINGPNYHPWQKAANDENGDDYAPQKEPTASPPAHRGKHLRVDYGVVDARNYLKENQADNNDDDMEYIHAMFLETTLR